MRRLLLVALVTQCQVYSPSLLLDASVDVAVEACGTMCGSVCVDLQTSQNNCGACGTTCEVGCAGGHCKPTVLVTGLGAPHGIVVNGEKVYIANNGSINLQSVSKIDGTGLTNFASSLLFPDRLATDGTILYWTDNANVMTGNSLDAGGNPTEPGGAVFQGAFNPPLPNCSGNWCYYVRDLPSPYGIAVQGTTMFFTTTGATNMSGVCAAGAWANSVMSCPITGCDVSNCSAAGGPTVLATGTKLASVAADSKNVYWADSGAHVIKYCAQPSCAGGALTMAQGLGMPFDVVSDGTTVFFTDRSAGKLYSCPTTGCGTAPKVLADQLNDPLLITVDATHVYVTLYGGGALVACLLPDCAGGAITLETGLHAPYGVTTDATYVYWAEEGTKSTTSTDGTLSKLKKL